MLAWWDGVRKGPFLFSGGLEPFPALPSPACACRRMDSQTFAWFYFKQANVPLAPGLLPSKERSCSFFFFSSQLPSLPHTSSLARCKLEGEGPMEPLYHFDRPKDTLKLHRPHQQYPSFRRSWLTLCAKGGGR